MTVNLSALAGAGQQFLDNNGNVLSGGKLYSYAAGTTTPQPTYTSAAGNTAHTNPIVLDSAGRVPGGEIWLTAGSNYKFVLNSSSSVLIATWDNITGINGTGIGADAAQVAYTDPFNNTTTVKAQLDTLNTAGRYDHNVIAAGTPAQINAYPKGGFLVGGGTPQSTNGMFLSSDGASNWLTVQVSKNENPTELILYPSSAQGYATTVPGGNTVTRVTGSPFQKSWEGKNIYFMRAKYRVLVVSSVDSMTVSETGGASVVWPSPAEIEAYNYSYTSGSGLCNVNGTTVTFVSGDPFVPLFFSDFEFTLNGVAYTVSSFVSPTQYTLSSSGGTATNVPFTWRGNINDQLTTLRVQAIAGTNEENFNLMSIAGDQGGFLGRYYTLNAGIAGPYGKFRPIYIGSGVWSDNSPIFQFGCYPINANGTTLPAYAAVGGVQGREGLRVYSPNTSAPVESHYALFPGGTFGSGPLLVAAGTPTDISPKIAAKGIGSIVFQNNVSQNLLKVGGVADSVNWLSISAAVTGDSPSIYIDDGSSDENVDLALYPKGTGVVKFGTYTATPITNKGYITIRDAAGNTRRLMCG